MTRKRIGTGLLESFSENCEHCQGRGVVIKEEPIEAGKSEEGDGRRSSGGNRRRGRRSGDGDDTVEPKEQGAPAPSPKDVAAMARQDRATAAADEAAADEAAAAADTESDTPVTPETESPKGDEVAAVEPEVAEPATDPTVEAVAEPEPEPVQAPVEASKPQVVTRTRRRSASRPAGPPPVPQVGVAGTAPESGVVEPGTVSVEPGTADAAADMPVVEHVPVKKRSRKR